MNFLDKMYFDNSIRSYLMAACVIVITVILKRFISRYIAFIFYKLANRIWKTLDKKNFFALLVEPLEWFLLIAITVFTLDKLRFPNILRHTIYGHSTADIISRTGTAFIIISFVWLLLRMVDFIALILKAQASDPNAKDNQLIIFFRDFLKVIIGVCGILLIIKACFSQHIGNLLTGLSLVGAALALAAKESLENLIASFIIFFDKPFFTNDVVTVNNITGKVERIGLRSTRIRTVDKTLVTMPNKQMVDSIVDNLSMRTNRRAEIKLELATKTSSTATQTFIDLLKKLIEQNTQNIVSSSVFLKDVSKSSLLITIEYFTEPFTLEEFFALKQHINLSIKKIIEENNIELAGDSSTIIINNDSNKG
jgi:MscS family membrane protein